MATTISIKVAGLTAERSFANDTKATEVLRLYAEYKGAAPENTNKQKLQFIVDQLVEEILRSARQQFLAEHQREQIAASEELALE